MVTYRAKAQKARVDSEVAAFQKAAAVYFATNQRYPDPRTAPNFEDACITNGGYPEKCCVSEGGCVYAGVGELETLATTGAGNEFAAAGRAPRWLALFGTRAEAILSGVLPRLPSEAPVSSDGFKGIFYECGSAGANCGDATIFFSIPEIPGFDSQCSKGRAHNGNAGICQQNITGANDLDGESSDDY
jgi:hypothetical protein